MHKFITQLKQEFTGYSKHTLKQDALAGITVTAVALPLALAFGVASGATAAAGLITAIIAGIVISFLSGAPYQISGPTGAMSAILILLVQQYGLVGLWGAGLIAGALMILLGLLKMGKLIAYIPAPVITGFTSGIALIIAIGQLDNLLGITTPGTESAALKLWGYLQGGFTPNIQCLLFGGLVIAVMILWPKKWQARFPSSLAGILLAVVLVYLTHWQVASVGDIPRTLLPADRLTLFSIPWRDLGGLITPAVTIAALGMIESLLCGAVASNMTGIPLDADQELVAQGVGNVLLPFVGGVPATAAIARTSVGIRSGGKTRLTGIFHAFGLLLSMFVLAPVMSRIPLSALAGVLIVTAWRMNEWSRIRLFFGRRMGGAMVKFMVTMLATVVLDLTQAILLGVVVSAVLYLKNSANLQVSLEEVDVDRLKVRGIENAGTCRHTRVAYLTGPLFFGSIDKWNDAFTHLGETHTLILSMRGVPLIDTSGLEAMTKLKEMMTKQDSSLLLAGVQPEVMRMLKKSGMLEHFEQQNIFWSADQAIIEAETRGCKRCEAMQEQASA